MKNVLIDLIVSQPVLSSKFHGGGEYTKTIFKELTEKYLDEINLVVIYDSRRFIDEWILEIIKTKSIKTYDVFDYSLVNQIIREENVEVFFAGLMTNITKVDFPSNIRVIGVYHGFRSLEKPIDNSAPLYENKIAGYLKQKIKVIGKKSYFRRKYNEEKCKINKCTDIVGVSKHSGYAAKVFFPHFPQDKIHVFYSPQKYVNKIELIKDREKSILMLGGDRWIKNLYRGAMAIDQLFSSEQLPNFNVTVVGGIPKRILRKIHNKSRFIQLPYLSSLDLEKEYQKCDFFFYPTLNEGFGYPPEEVMKFGKTCVISSINSLIEVYQDSVYYCNPYDLNEMKCRLLQAANEKIEEETIKKNLIRISNKQKEDLFKLCELICH